MRAGLLALALAGCGWSTAQTSWGVASTLTIAADCAITEHYLDKGTEWVERNPLLGSRPTDFRLWTLCAAGAATVLIVADALPKARTPILISITAIELLFIGHNLMLWDIMP